MIVVMQPGASEEEIDAVIAAIMDLGFNPSRTTGQNQTVIAGIGMGVEDVPAVAGMAAVQEIFKVSKPYEKVRRTSGLPHQVMLGEFAVGSRLAVFHHAAPNEGEDALAVVASDARGGGGEPFEPFLICAAGGVAGVEPVGWYLSASLHNRKDLLRQLADSGKPVLLERLPGTTIDEILETVEQVLRQGMKDVILCESGAHCYDRQAAVGFDVTLLSALRRTTWLPVVVNVGRILHPADRWAALRAAASTGIDGVMVSDTAYFPEGWEKQLEALARCGR